MLALNFLVWAIETADSDFRLSQLKMGSISSTTGKSTSLNLTYLDEVCIAENVDAFLCPANTSIVRLRQLL